MDRAFFIQWEVCAMQVDDFCNLPVNRVRGIVWAAEDAAYARHEAAFYLTH